MNNILHEIHEHGYWCGEDIDKYHFFDEQLAITLLDFFKKERTNNLVDFGCGKADYIKLFIKNGIDCDVLNGY